MLSEGKVSHSEEWCFWAKKDVKLLDSIPQRWWEDWSTSLLREGLGGSYQCMLIAAGGMPGEWSQALLDGAHDRARGYRHTLKHRGSFQTFTGWVAKHWHRLPREVAVSPFLERIKNQLDTIPGQPALGVPGGVGHRCFPELPSVFLRDMGIWDNVDTEMWRYAIIAFMVFSF